MRRYGYEAAVPSAPLPTKHQLISCLASRGHWVTSQPDLQLDPPESQLLFLRGASLHFLFEPVWALSSAQQGDYLTILQTIVEKLETGVLRWALIRIATSLWQSVIALCVFLSLGRTCTRQSCWTRSVMNCLDWDLMA